MMNPEFNDQEDYDIVALIGHFEKYLNEHELHYFDEDELEQLLEYYEMRNQPEKAEALIDLAISQNPYSSDFFVRKAEYLLNRKQYEAALELLDKAALFDSGEIDIYLIRSDVYVEMNDTAKALETLGRALTIANSEEKCLIYGEMSDVYEILEDFQTAYAMLVKALDNNPANEEILTKISHVVDMTDRFEESIELHRRLIDRDPYAFLAWFNLGRAYAGMNLYEKAIESYEFCMAVNEDFDLVYRDAADLYFRMEDFAKAIAMFETAEDKAGGFEDYSFRIGQCYESMGNFKSARFHFRKATRKDPFLHEAYFRIGETYRIEERYEAALVNYKKALKLEAENEDYICRLIGALIHFDREDETLQAMRGLVNLRPDILNYWMDYILYMCNCKKYADALDVLSEAMTRCGHYAEFFYLECIPLYYTGRIKESLSVLQYALDNDFARHTLLAEADMNFYYLPSVQSHIEMFRN